MSERKTPEEMEKEYATHKAECTCKGLHTDYAKLDAFCAGFKTGAEQARLDAIEEAGEIVIEMGQHVQGGYNHCAKLMWDKIQTLKTRPDPRNGYANINKITGEIG